MSKAIIETKDTIRELSAEELTTATGGRWGNVYSNGDFYSGATVHSPWKQQKHQKNKKKR